MQGEKQIGGRDPIGHAGFHNAVRSERAHSGILIEYFFGVQIRALYGKSPELPLRFMQNLGEGGCPNGFLNVFSYLPCGYTAHAREEAFVSESKFTKNRLDGVERVAQGKSRAPPEIL